MQGVGCPEPRRAGSAQAYPEPTPLRAVAQPALPPQSELGAVSAPANLVYCRWIEKVWGGQEWVSQSWVQGPA